MTNKKRIGKLLNRKYCAAYRNPRVVAIFDEYVVGYDFAFEFEKVAKASEEAARNLKQFFIAGEKLLSANDGIAYIIEFFKKTSLENFKNEYLNNPIDPKTEEIRYIPEKPLIAFPSKNRFICLI